MAKIFFLPCRAVYGPCGGCLAGSGKNFFPLLAAPLGACLFAFPALRNSESFPYVEKWPLGSKISVENPFFWRIGQKIFYFFENIL